MAPKQSLRLIDVLSSLLDRDRVDEAVDIQVDAIFLAVEHDLDVLDILEMTIDEYVKLYEPPKRVVLPKVRGRWDKVIYGEAAFREEPR